MNKLLITAFMLALALAVEAQNYELTESRIGCRDKPVTHSEAVQLYVLDSWIRDNSLFANLAVTNRSVHSVLIPTRNLGGHYWDAQIRNSKGEPIIYCGGVSEINLNPLSELVGRGDIAEVRPGQTIVLRAVYLAPFWPYLWDADRDAQSFVVTYIGWSAIDVNLERSQLPKLQKALNTASQLQCQLYGGELRSQPQKLVR